MPKRAVQVGQQQRREIQKTAWCWGTVAGCIAKRAFPLFPKVVFCSTSGKCERYDSTWAKWGQLQRKDLKTYLYNV